MSFRYTRSVFRAGDLVHREEVTLSAPYVETLSRRPGRAGFLELLNQWNRQGLRHFERGLPLYVYTEADPSTAA